MANFGIFRGFSEKLFEGELPLQLGTIGSASFGFNGVLDLQPNALYAYSLRKLRLGYTGSAVRVRRTNGDELDIGFVETDINKPLDIAALTAFCGAGNGFVTTWYDQSGNARNAVQTATANQPLIFSNGSAIVSNGKPSIRFLSPYFLRTGSFTYANPVHVFSYFMNNANGGFLFDGAFSVNQFRLYIDSNTAMSVFANGGTPVGYTDLTGVINKNYLFDGLVNGANSKFQFNNTTALNVNWGNSSINGLTIGKAGGTSGFEYNGFITEMIGYNSNTLSSNIIKDNINEYYAIY